MFFQLFVLCFVIKSIVDAFPCPSECFCRPMSNDENEFYRMSLNIDCRNVSLKENQLNFRVEQWTIEADLIDDEQHFFDSYRIDLDLSETFALKEFNSNSVNFLDFRRRSISSFTLTSSTKHFRLDSNSFDNEIYRDVIFLNLSSCCNEMPDDCSRLFEPLRKLERLDLSATSMYKNCFDRRTIETISATLRDLILRSNIYDVEMFHSSSKLFDAVRDISGLLDLQNSRFRWKNSLDEVCLFDLFNQISSLDLSNIEFESKTNDIEKNLAILIRCENANDEEFRRVGQLENLYLRNLNLRHLPKWFSSSRFSQLIRLDLSSNKIRQIDLQMFDRLRQIDFASNPLRFDRIQWRTKTIYQTINLRRTTNDVDEEKANRTFDLSTRLETLAMLTADFDYSENPSNDRTALTNLPLAGDFSSNQTRLKLSQTNLNSFESNWNELQYLDVSSNFLRELNLEQQMKLIVLDCSNQQQLTKLTFYLHLSTLEELRCSNNSLKNLDNFSPHRKDKLRSIDLSRNRFESLEKIFANFTGRYLTTVKFQWNFIRIIRSNLFHSGLIRLIEIDLSWNRIETIERSAFQSANLQSIDLTGNPLKFVEAKAIFTSSLRFFFVFNSTNEFVERCVDSSNDDFISTFIDWFERNGTLMKRRYAQRSEPIQLSRCSKSIGYSIQVKGKKFFNSYSIHLTVATISTFVLFAALYLYRMNSFRFFERCRRYRRLDRHCLVEDAEDIDQQHREDDEIVINLTERPFNTGGAQQPTHV